MGYIKIWVHLVWSTKRREALLKPDLLHSIIKHVKENARDKKIHIDFINGHREHIHVLISLKSTQTIARIMQHIKGESASWINQQKIVNRNFSWQSEYFAVSVGESQVGVVRSYIKKQEEHHRKKSYGEEVEEFMEKYGFKRVRG